MTISHPMRLNGLHTIVSVLLFTLLLEGQCQSNNCISSAMINSTVLAGVVNQSTNLNTTQLVFECNYAFTVSVDEYEAVSSSNETFFEDSVCQVININPCNIQVVQMAANSSNPQNVNVNFVIAIPNNSSTYTQAQTLMTTIYTTMMTSVLNNEFNPFPSSVGTVSACVQRMDPDANLNPTGLTKTFKFIITAAVTILICGIIVNCYWVSRDNKIYIFPGKSHTWCSWLSLLSLLFTPCYAFWRKRLVQKPTEVQRTPSFYTKLGDRGQAT